MLESSWSYSLTGYWRLSSNWQEKILLLERCRAIIKSCRADFLSNRISSRWSWPSKNSYIIIPYPKKLTSNSLHNLSRVTKSVNSDVILIVHQSQIWKRWLISCFLSTVGGYFEAYSSQFSGSTFGPNFRPSQTAWTVEEQIFKSKMWLKQRNQNVLPRPWFLRIKVHLRIYEVLCIFIFVCLEKILNCGYLLYDEHFYNFLRITFFIKFYVSKLRKVFNIFWRQIYIIQINQKTYFSNVFSELVGYII